LSNVPGPLEPFGQSLRGGRALAAGGGVDAVGSAASGALAAVADVVAVGDEASGDVVLFRTSDEENRG
jgi:hypothetical protein